MLFHASMKRMTVWPLYLHKSWHTHPADSNGVKLVTLQTTGYSGPAGKAAGMPRNSHGPTSRQQEYNIPEVWFLHVARRNKFLPSAYCYAAEITNKKIRISAQIWVTVIIHHYSVWSLNRLVTRNFSHVRNSQEVKTLLFVKQTFAIRFATCQWEVSTLTNRSSPFAHRLVLRALEAKKCLSAVKITSILTYFDRNS